ncbi:phosphohistidine phosphatase [Mesonia hippocampi]|uniref:Phosphohistidine phosphatase n=1 Tax=Mesonia hippocampi TaxID=1628250 RepID=A0A840EME6_9FLAO|nr:histidine phosphatase family protein [Mesonia hippocampi]MBB4119559.1 phosphohistidine phosphatase [Mesonia hippocampi]
MKRLILVRHGKSSWADPALKDIDRPLKKRGFTDAELIIKAFNAEKISEEAYQVYTSPAKRALTTAKLFSDTLARTPKDFNVLSNLYTFNTQELLHVIYTLEEKSNACMLFGHNPAITEVANLLGNKEIANIPTTGLIVIEADVKSWASFAEGKTTLKLFPKMFK